MAGTDTPEEGVTLSLDRATHWTLHHVLVDRVEGTATAPRGENVEPPLPAVASAFEVVDAGGTRLTVRQLEAVRNVLAAYHHRTTWWEVERPKLERLLHVVTNAIDRGQTCRVD